MLGWIRTLPNGSYCSYILIHDFRKAKANDRCICMCDKHAVKPASRSTTMSDAVIYSNRFDRITAVDAIQVNNS